MAKLFLLGLLAFLILLPFSGCTKRTLTAECENPKFKDGEIIKVKGLDEKLVVRNSRCYDYGNRVDVINSRGETHELPEHTVEKY